MSTKFLRKSTRRLIRDFDQFQNAYPAIVRSSDPIDNGIDTNVIFEDTGIVVFSENNTSFPSMMPVGMTNEPSSSIVTKVLVKPSNLEQKPKLPGSVEGLIPYNETTLNLPATYYNTASITLAPGFSIPARNKIAIPIDITANQEKFLFRLGSSDTNSDPDGLFYGQSSTGFCYYNFDLKQWEDIGLNSSYTGHLGQITPTTEYTFSGQNYFMAQFVGTPNSILPTTTAETGLYKGYNKIGSPTEFFDAPVAPRYHASASQGLLMSNYVDQPYVLERIDVTLPFVARRSHGPVITGPYAESALRDVDNLVFFVYRQSGVDDQQLSVRSLIAHESLSFYNQRINTDINYEQHKPVFAHDFDISLTSATEKFFTGSVSFTMYPKVTSKNFAGTTAYSIKDTATATPTYRRAGILNFWSGPQESVLSSSTNVVDGTLQATGNNDFWRIENTTMSGTSYNKSTFRSKLDPDARFLTNYATGALFPVQKSSTYTLGEPRYNSVNWSQYATPYVIFPKDKIIFGIEADICTKSPTDRTYDSGYDSSYLSVTSSYFKILTQQAKVTLYGSLVQSNVAKSVNSINQNLVSPAVHEIIANVQSDSDQFDIDERSLYVGTYLDNFITGSMLLNTRAIAQSIIDGPQITSGSFIRSLPLSDKEKTYWQSGATEIFGFSFPYLGSKNPKNYFRYNRYGNLRDMLEQAQDYRIFNKLLYKKQGGFEDRGPAYALFVLSSSETPVSASSTTCNNLSPYMTATFPFDDTITGSLSRGPYPTSTFNSPFTPRTLIFKT